MSIIKICGIIWLCIIFICFIEAYKAVQLDPKEKKYNKNK